MEFPPPDLHSAHLCPADIADRRQDIIQGRPPDSHEAFIRGLWTSVFCLLLSITACKSEMDVKQDSIQNANQKMVSTASKTGFSLIEVPEGISTREVAQQLRINGIRPLVVTPDAQIIIEALNVDPAILPPETQITPLESPYRELPDSEDGGEEPLVEEASQSFSQHMVTDAIIPTEGELEKRGEATWDCINPPYCFPSLSETVGVQVFFPESKVGVADEHEDWEPGEIEQAMKVFHFELASLARVAPLEARLIFYVTNLGALEVSGEPTSGYAPDSVLNELLPKLRTIHQISPPATGIGGLPRSSARPMREAPGVIALTTEASSFMNCSITSERWTNISPMSLGRRVMTGSI